LAFAPLPSTASDLGRNKNNLYGICFISNAVQLFASPRKKLALPINIDKLSIKLQSHVNQKEKMLIAAISQSHWLVRQMIHRLKVHHYTLLYATYIYTSFDGFYFYLKTISNILLLKK